VKHTHYRLKLGIMEISNTNTPVTLERVVVKEYRSSSSILSAAELTDIVDATIIQLSKAIDLAAMRQGKKVVE